jgi:soluble lytic murein transglycosylase
MPNPREVSASGAFLPWFAACLALLCFTIGGAAGVEDALAAQRAEFQQAWSQIPGAAPSDDSGRLRRYVLFPYLQAARLEQALVAAGSNVPDSLDQQMGAFLRAHEDEPVARDLRRRWLTSLAARARWQEFLSFHRDNDEAALRCLGFAARIELARTADLAPQVIQSWLTPRSLPECDRAFTWLDSTGGLTAALIEQRVRLTLEADNAGFARQIAVRLPADRAAPLLQWAALLENPQRGIDALITTPQTAVEPGALRAGWTKLARANRTTARQRFDRLVRSRQLDRHAASPLALALALALSWDRDADALRYFSRVEPADFDDSAREWQARAALWAGDWKQVSRSIEALSEAARGTARWRYWAARVAAHEGRQAAAQQLYESILKDDNYYSGMAAARLKRPVAPNPQVLPADAALLASLENMPAFARARELRLNAQADKARAEWRLAQSQLQPPARPQAIHLAARWGWYEQAVATATGEQVFNDYALLYPRPHDAEVDAAAKVSGLAPTLIYSVIRQESLYQRDALSSAGAQGLMQLTPDTARRTARQWKQPAPAATSLFEPAVNVMLGSAHLKDLLDRFDGQLPLALAGYNAGPGAAQRWLPEDAMDPDIWIENIPYNETRSYVQRILWHTVVFHWLREGEATDTRGWLKDVRR